MQECVVEDSNIIIMQESVITKTAKISYTHARICYTENSKK